MWYTLRGERLRLLLQATLGVSLRAWEKRKATIAARAAQPSSRLDQLLGCCVSTKNRNIFSIEKSARETTSTHLVILSKRGSLFSFTTTGECILTRSGPWLIPVVLLGRMPKHDSRNAIEASLRANPPSQSPSFHLSLPIAIITGDHRQIHYPATTTLVSLLSYNSAILYSSCFPLLLSGPSFSNPPTSCLLYTSPSPRD